MRRRRWLSVCCILLATAVARAQSSSPWPVHLSPAQTTTVRLDASSECTAASERFDTDPLAWFALHLRLRRSPGVNLSWSLQGFDAAGQLAQRWTLDLQNDDEPRQTHLPAAPYDQDYVLWFCALPGVRQAEVLATIRPGGALVNSPEVAIVSAWLERCGAVGRKQLGRNVLSHGQWQGPMGDGVPRGWTVWKQPTGSTLTLRPDPSRSAPLLAVHSDGTTLLGAATVPVRIVVPGAYTVLATVRGQGKFTLGVHGLRDGSPPKRVADSQQSSYPVSSADWTVIEHDWYSVNPHVDALQVYLGLEGNLDVAQVELLPWVSDPSPSAQ